MSTLRKLAASHFRMENSADNNRVFLWENCDEPPFMRPVSGWKIVGYGDTPWPKADYKLVVMFEKTTPANPNLCSIKGEEMAEGTRIWQHAREGWVPGMPSPESLTARAKTA